MRDFSRLALLVAAAGALSCSEPPAPAPLPVAARAAPLPPLPAPLDPPVSFEVRSGRVLRDETIVAALGRVGVGVARTNDLVDALKGTFDFRRSRPGDEYRVTTDPAGGLTLFEYKRGPVEEYRVRRDGEKLVGERRSFELSHQVAELSATLESSLWEAIAGRGEDPQLALAFADVFAWDVDFYLDPRKGDTIRLVVEKDVHAGRTVRYGEILAAEYAGSLTGTKRVYRYVDPATGVAGYYGEDGSSTKRTFLKSPLKFALVTSGFGSRLHPVLKYVRQHAGVDYGAATGTPIWAVGDGVVTKAGWDAGCGNMVSLRHANGLETIYCHMSRLGEGLHGGLRVAQKRVIGFVGKTGLATGPHLHYAVKRGGTFVNPLSLKFPPADPIPAAGLAAFHEAIGPSVKRLSSVTGTEVASAPGTEPEPEPAAAAQ